MFAELSVTSNFTFLTGASHPEEYMRRAADLGLAAIAIADDNSVAGIVRAHAAAREIARAARERLDLDAAQGLVGPPRPAYLVPPPARRGGLPRLIPAARLVFADAPPVTALVADRQGWANLCRILTAGRLRAPKGGCLLHLHDLLERSEGLELLLWPDLASGPASGPRVNSGTESGTESGAESGGGAWRGASPGVAGGLCRADASADGAAV